MAVDDSNEIYSAFEELSRLAMIMARQSPDDIARAGEIIWRSLQAGGKVLACGNGGSAADAQHIVAELVGRMLKERGSLPAISLASDPSVVTALGNDYGYENLFSRQVEGLGKVGDVLLAISTSGRSPNVLNAIRTAKDQGLKTVALVGPDGDALLDDCDVCIRVPSDNTQRIQEIHSAVLHAICGHVENQIEMAVSKEKRT